MPITLFTSLSEHDKSEAIKSIIEHSSPRQEFFLMVVLSVLMATMGLLLDSAAVIIGSMLIAPLLFPILSLSLGVVIADSKVILRSLATLVNSVVLAVVAATFLSLLFSPIQYSGGQEILSRTEPSLAYAVVAFVAGLAAAFAMVRPNLSETLPGIAISVAIIPPLAVMGIGLARFDPAMMRNSFLLFLVNTVGIIFANMIVFSMMRLYVKRQMVEEEVKKDDKVIKHEEEVAKAKAA